MECHVNNMSDDVISPAPPLSVSGPVVSMFAARRDNLISRAAANAKSHLSEGGGEKKKRGFGDLQANHRLHQSTGTE